MGSNLCKFAALAGLLSKATYFDIEQVADRAILRLLAVMESNGIVVNVKRPLMFGPPAVNLLMNDQTEKVNKFSGTYLYFQTLKPLQRLGDVDFEVKLTTKTFF